MALSDSNLKQVRTIVKEEINESLDEKLTELKSDFFERVDPILKKVVTAREERPLLENRMEKLEAIHLKGKRQFSS